MSVADLAGGDETHQMPPIFVRHVDQSLQAIEPLGVDYEAGMEILRAVDSLAVGTAVDDAHESEMSAEKEQEFLNGGGPPSHCNR